MDFYITIVALAALLLFSFGLMIFSRSIPNPKLESRQVDGPHHLRREKAFYIFRLTSLNDELETTTHPILTDFDMKTIELTHLRVQEINDHMIKNGDWLGPPYDLEWVDIFSQLPRLRHAFLEKSLRSDDVLNSVPETAGDIALPGRTDAELN